MVKTGSESSPRLPDEHIFARRKKDVNHEAKWGVRLSGDASFRPINYKVEPPAMASWSPASSSFFINDGESSGMSSILRFFRISGQHVTRDDSIQKAAVRRYRKTVGCLPSAVDPNIWGVGWSADGKQLFLLVQATVNESCGVADGFIGLIVNVSDNSVAEQLTTSQTTRRFRSLLPPELLQK